jgi:hypothetical protein
LCVAFFVCFVIFVCFVVSRPSIMSPLKIKSSRSTFPVFELNLRRETDAVQGDALGVFDFDAKTRGL